MAIVWEGPPGVEDPVDEIVAWFKLHKVDAMLMPGNQRVNVTDGVCHYVAIVTDDNGQEVLASTDVVGPLMTEARSFSVKTPFPETKR